EGAAEAEEAEEAAGRRHAAATLGRAPAAGPTARVTWPRATRRATSRRRGSAASPSPRNLGAISGPPMSTTLAHGLRELGEDAGRRFPAHTGIGDRLAVA